jgi:selenocysteine lyase/cysteine desulfurase
MGILWMRPEHTTTVWPLVPSPRSITGMSRYEWIGTAPDYVGPAALPALEMHERIGPARKAARLQYLAGLLRDGLHAAVPSVMFYTREGEEMSCGLTTLEIPGADAPALQRRLRAEHSILVQAMSGGRAPEIAGLRVSPNVYHTPAEVERFVAALAAVTTG